VFNYTNMPLFVETEPTGEVAAQSLDRSLAGDYIVSVIATVPDQPVLEAAVNPVYVDFILTIIDPCLTTTITGGL
jgi:hypothetical protein